MRAALLLNVIQGKPNFCTQFETFGRLLLLSFRNGCSEMSLFYFKTVDNDGMVPDDLPFEFPDLFAAMKRQSTCWPKWRSTVCRNGRADRWA